MKHKQQREQAYGVKSRENQAQSSKSLLPVDSHRISLSPPALNHDNTWEVLSTREAYQTCSAQGFTRAGHTGTLYIVHTKTLDSQRKAGFSIKHVVCIVQAQLALLVYYGMVSELP